MHTGQKYNEVDFFFNSLAFKNSLCNTNIYNVYYKCKMVLEDKQTLLITNNEYYLIISYKSSLLTLKVFGNFGYIKGTWRQKNIYLHSGVSPDVVENIVLSC